MKAIMTAARRLTDLVARRCSGSVAAVTDAMERRATPRCFSNTSTVARLVLRRRRTGQPALFIVLACDPRVFDRVDRREKAALAPLLRLSASLRSRGRMAGVPALSARTWQRARGRAVSHLAARGASVG